MLFETVSSMPSFKIIVILFSIAFILKLTNEILADFRIFIKLMPSDEFNTVYKISEKLLRFIGKELDTSNEPRKPVITLTNHIESKLMLIMAAFMGFWFAAFVCISVLSPELALYRQAVGLLAASAYCIAGRWFYIQSMKAYQ